MRTPTSPSEPEGRSLDGSPPIGHVRVRPPASGNGPGLAAPGFTLVLAVVLVAACDVARDAPDERPTDGPPYDLLLRGGAVVDGTGDPAFPADVAVSGARIARVARAGLPADSAREVLDATDLVVAPGFVDHHAHIQAGILDRPLLENFLRQGITTILASLHSHDQPWPLDEHMAAVESALNVGFFAGHTWTRRRVLGTEDRAPTREELEEMRALVETSMQHGALGLSTGLLYVPAQYAETEEVVELARVAARHGGVYYTHMRDEGRRLIEAVEEAIRIGLEADIPVQIQHHKAFGPGQWGWTERTLAMIDSARAEGLDVKHDVYPYDAASTGSTVLFPAWALAGGADSLRARLEDPATLEAIKAEMEEMWRAEWTGDDLARIQFRTVPADRRYDGRTLAELAEDRGLPNTVEAGIELAIELQLDGGFSAIYHGMDEADVIRIMEHPYAMFQTDGDPVGYGIGFPHPRSYGSFPRVLARYVRELEVLTLEEAVRRMTSLSMGQIGQEERGVIREGLYADLVAFDPAGIEDRATFLDPHRFSVGIIHSVVNGVAVLRDGSLTGERPGRVLRGPARPDRVAAGDGEG